MRSLVTRVLVAAGVVLVFFLGLTVVALDVAFRSTAERAIRDRLQVQVLALLASLEVDEDGRAWMPEQLPEPRYAHPGSGLYAQIRDGDGELVWRSPSAVGLSGSSVPRVEPGVTVFDRITPDDGAPLFRYRFTVVWDTGDASREAPTYHVTVAETLAPYEAQLARFRANLLGWFGLVFIGLVIAQQLILKRMLRPLRRLGEEVAEIESGRRDVVGDGYPTELSALARNLNALVRNERGNLQRYRETLADLAHSVKTPLAVMRVALDEPAGVDRDATLGQQVTRMDEIVGYQLQRARAVGSETFARVVDVGSMVEELVAALRKVYGGRSLDLVTEVEAGTVFRGGRGDFLEMVGNLLDNACKWARSRVGLTVVVEGDRLHITIDDDGPGIPISQRASMTTRGIRGDESVDGQGIGLAVTNGLAHRLGGELRLEGSEMGGLRAVLVLPA